jgi:steroid delta-isomerase
MALESQHPIHNYALLFSQLTPDNLSDIAELVSDDVVFSDPFNLTYGRNKFIRIFQHMFDVIENPKFEILDVSFSSRAGYIKWRLTGKVKKWKQIIIDITGISEVISDEAGQITAHYDHWDSASQLLVAIPALGLPIAWLLNLFRLK